MKLAFSIIFALVSLTTFAQIIVKPIAHDEVRTDVNHNGRSLIDADSILAELDTLQLPFWEDFSTSGTTPNADLWHQGVNVYVNSSLGSNPPTLNVATFDGADVLGFPYNLTANSPQLTDILVSQAVDLSDLTDADQVVFSFFWQAGGNADRPESVDQIELSFWNNEEQPGWDSVWAVTGESVQISADFSLQTIPITQEKYLHAGFRFKFEVTGNTSGAFDAWHIDYVYLNRDRPRSGESLDDHAVSLQPSSIFAPYTMIPRSQLFEYGDTIFNSPTFALSSFESSVFTVDYSYNLVQIDQPGINDNSRRVLFTNTPTQFIPLNGVNDQQAYEISGISADLFDPQNDSISLISEVIFRTGDGLIPLTDNEESGQTFLDSETFNFRINDTARYFFQVHELLAYDDGTAELAAGLDRRGGQLAVRFDLAAEDLLTDIDIYFPRIGALPTNRRFRLSIYDELTDAAPIITNEFSRSDSDHAVDRFETFTMPRPARLFGEFYVVFEQFSEEYFPIGLDLNNPVEEQIFVNLEGTWLPATADNLPVDGALMIRPRFSTFDGLINEVISELSNLPVVYPNPAKDNIQFSDEIQGFALFDLSGQLVLSGNGKTAEVGHLQNGMYLVRLSDRNKNVITQKILIQH